MLTERVYAYAKKHQLLRRGGRVVVAVSGGPDSVALLDVLYRLRGRLALKLWVAHLNHRIRGSEAEADARWTRSLAHSLGLPVLCESCDVLRLAQTKKLSLETAARQARYNFLEHAAGEVRASRIAVGHTASDQVETLLMRLLRGTGPDGLAGMPPARGRIIRPFLEVFRDEVEAYCRQRGLSPRRDSSNQERACLRNRVRLDLLPFLQESFNPRVDRTLLRLVHIMQAENEFMESRAREAFQAVRKEADNSSVGLDLAALGWYDSALQRRVIRLAIEQLKGNRRSIGFAHVDALLEQVRREGTHQVDLPGDLEAECAYGTLRFRRRVREPEHLEGTLQIPGVTALPEVGLRFEAAVHARTAVSVSPDAKTAYLDYDRVPGPVRVRGRMPGDRFRPLGMRETKKLKEFFIDNKVPLRERDRIPLLASEGTILWVVGHRISDEVKVNPETRRVLQIEVSTENE